MKILSAAHNVASAASRAADLAMVDSRDAGLDEDTLTIIRAALDQVVASTWEAARAEALNAAGG